MTAILIAEGESKMTPAIGSMSVPDHDGHSGVISSRRSRLAMAFMADPPFWRLQTALTFEGRYTLGELISRLRNAGYLRTAGIRAQDPADALEQLIIHLGGGEVGIKFYHIVDRREFLSTIRSLKLAKPPKNVAR